MQVGGHQGSKMGDSFVPFKKRKVWMELALSLDTAQTSASDPSPSFSSQQPLLPPTPPLTSQPQKLSSVLSKGDATDSIKTPQATSSKQASEPQTEIHLTKEVTNVWGDALKILLGERDRLCISEDDKAYWDMAIDTLISVKSSQSVTPRKSDEGAPQANWKRLFVPQEEHSLAVEHLAEITKETDAIRAKCEASETQRLILEQIQQQYKEMLSERSEEVYKMKKMSRIESKNVPCGVATLL